VFAILCCCFHGLLYGAGRLNRNRLLS
jgi:hypothetical protein